MIRAKLYSLKETEVDVVTPEVTYYYQGSLPIVDSNERAFVSKIDRISVPIHQLVRIDEEGNRVKEYVAVSEEVRSMLYLLASGEEHRLTTENRILRNSLNSYHEQAEDLRFILKKFRQKSLIQRVLSAIRNDI